MSRMQLKLTIGAVVIAAAVALLALAGVRDGWVYYLPVDQFTADAHYQDSRVRLHGKVSEENLELNAALLSARFDLRGQQSSIRVTYSGVIPEMFKAGSDVVVEGALNQSGEFKADTLMTKCASKYESADGQAPHADPRKGGDA